MTIETKYSVGDEIWIMLNDKATTGKVKAISVDPYENNINYDLLDHIKYHIHIPTAGSNNIQRIEKFVFKTKAELLKSL